MPSRESRQDCHRIDVAGPAALGEAIATVRRFAFDHELSARDMARLCIVVEELITNLCDHGICETECEIGLELSRQSYGLVLVFEDNGAPFDPRTVSDAGDVPTRGGGAGLRLVHAWSTIVGYQSANGRNRLELTLALSDR